MAKRTTKIAAQAEYIPPHKARTTKIIAQAEYIPPHKARTSKIVVMVEYVVSTGRRFGPPIGVG